MRPQQWSKNAIVFAALVFDRQLFEYDNVLPVTIAFISFCLASSSVYILNDVRDVDQDRQHPRKRFRPIASGELTLRHAAIAATVSGLTAVVLGWLVAGPLAIVILTYIGIMVGYSSGLKHLVIVDVCLIAAGFVLRAVGGAVAIAVPVSLWLYVCTALLALFIGFGKRRAELANPSNNGSISRSNLDAYSIPLLDRLIAIAAAATVIAYTLYTFEGDSAQDSDVMVLTVPFVIYAILRYIRLIYREHEAEEPERLLVNDRPLLASIAGWGLSTMVILYALP